jgi:glycopeptide antibiotics resistance protein
MDPTRRSSNLGFALLAYMLVLTLMITLVPFRFHWPQRFDFLWMDGWLDTVTNVILFLPLGFLYQLTRRDAGGPWCLRALLLGLLLSSTIEVAQLFLRGRYSSFIDLVTNGLGAWLGAGLHEAVKQQLNRRLVGKLALELPLMNIVYLLIPLLWLNGLGTGKDISRLWLAPLLGLTGGSTLAAIYIHRLRPAGILAPSTLALVVAIWFWLASLPSVLKNTLPLLGAGLLLACAVGGQVAWVLPLRETDRRFELPALKRALPIFAAYLGLLAVWPLGAGTVTWRSSLGFAFLSDELEILPVVRLLEYWGGFTVFGYLLAESRGRREEPLPVMLQWVLASCFVFAVFLEWLRGFHPQYGASLAHLMVTIGASLQGAIIYRLQLAAVQGILRASPAQFSRG